jgi:multidrug efflux pump subunit AcrB
MLGLGGFYLGEPFKRRHMAMGKDSKTAAADGTNEVAMAVVAVTIVIMAVFGPISFLSEKGGPATPPSFFLVMKS